jgi:hypothetical protein
MSKDQDSAKKSGEGKGLNKTEPNFKETGPRQIWRAGAKVTELDDRKAIRNTGAMAPGAT